MKGKIILPGCKSAYVYIAYAADAAGTAWSLTPTDLLKYRAEIHSTTPKTPVEADFVEAVWMKYIGADGAQGIPGADGAQGIDGADGPAGADGLQGAPGPAGADGSPSYTYIAYAISSDGNGFSLNPTIGLDYVAFKASQIAIPNPQASDFIGLWREYSGVVQDRVLMIKVSSDSSVLTAGFGKVKFHVPEELNGLILLKVSASLSTPAVIGSTIIDLYNYTQLASHLTTKITIDVNEITTYTAAVPSVVNVANRVMVTGNILGIDVNQVGTSSKGLTVTLTFSRL